MLFTSLERAQNSRGTIIRPLNVQERIRELNLRASAFADTLMAIKEPPGKPYARSVGVSTIHSGIGPGRKKTFPPNAS